MLCEHKSGRKIQTLVGYLLTGKKWKTLLPLVPKEIFEPVNTNISVSEKPPPRQKKGRDTRYREARERGWSHPTAEVTVHLSNETKQYRFNIIGNNLWMHHYLL